MTALWALTNHPSALVGTGVISLIWALVAFVQRRWWLGTWFTVPGVLCIIAGLLILRALKI